jgi:ribosomal protein L37E
MIYVLLLEQRKIYVGYSARPVGDRFIEHFNYHGSKWTSTYRPLEVLQVIEGGHDEENELTLQMMQQYGWWNVRGGKWCQVNLASCPTELLQRQNLKLPKRIQRAESLSCKRCGRNTHVAKDCFARTHVSGKDLPFNSLNRQNNRKEFEMMDCSSESTFESTASSFESPASSGKRTSDACFRCGRKSHFARDCFARSDIYGNKLL